MMLYKNLILFFLKIENYSTKDEGIVSCRILFIILSNLSDALKFNKISSGKLSKEFKDMFQKY